MWQTANIWPDTPNPGIADRYFEAGMRDFRWHLTSAGGGVASLAAIVYLLTHGLADSPLASPFAHVALPLGSGAFYIPGPVVQWPDAQTLQLSAAGSAPAALMIVAAGVPLFCLGLPWSWSYASWGSLRPLAAPFGALDGVIARVPLVLGGVLI